MTIAIDFVGTNLGSGTKTYNINFCKELEIFELDEDVIIYICRNYIDQINFSSSKNKRIKYILKPNFLSNIIFRLIWMQLILPFELKIKKIKKLYSPMNFSPIISKFLDIKVILALHSNLPWVYFNLMPGKLLRNLLTKKLMEISIKSCEKLIVDSYYAKEEIANILKLNRDKIKVIYLGIDKKFLSSKTSNNFIDTFNYKKKYIISVLSCVKYHNILNLLKAYKILLDEIDFKINLVLVMQILDKKYYKILKNFINLNFKENNIIIMTEVDSKNLPNLYKFSELYIFTSYCEVFGLTSLEAMAQKCPVLISNKSALPEINSDAADYFDPDNVIEIKNKIKKNLLDQKYREFMIEKGNKNLIKFSWENNINKTLKLISSL